MIQFPLKQFKILLIHLESYAECLLFTVYHHAALQKIQHHIDQFRLQIIINLVKIDIVILNNLELIACLVA